ncbi:MAG: hypothetical protein H5T82_09245 [Demequina sp.]|uniref:hypothetical protein n=1 Tax=Demequina sp. TaxID=2050685 RepID=UPI0019934D11|nr:hypothetical protein [Demequina sp.]MBC7299067.1 hypothetical protein [Demequina sp.]
MDAQPRPLLGSFLGLLLGIVVVALLWQLGVVPPDRLVLFGVLAVTIALVTIVLTQRTALVRKRFILVMVLCGLLAGVAVAGLPGTIAGGSISEACSADGTSSLDSKTPDQTSLADPFDVTRTDTVQWNGASADVLTNWRSALGLDIGGFQVKVWDGSSANDERTQSNSGAADVESYLGDIEGSTGIRLAGIYHVYGHLDADQGTCDMSAYVRVQGEGAFTGTLNMALWIALAALILITAILAGVVRHSITRSATVAGGPSSAAVAADPPPTQNRAKGNPARAESGRGTKPESQRSAPGEPMGVEGQHPMPGDDEPRARGDIAGGTREPDASSPPGEAGATPNDGGTDTSQR